MSKITIIIPFFNPGDKIMNSLESLNNQKDKNFTAIFINDGSTDNSLDILQDELKKSTFNYTIINQRNKGVSAARNKGIDLVKTEYLMFLDSDDILSKDAIKLLNNNLAGNIDLLYWKFNKTNNEKKIIWEYNESYELNSENLLYNYFNLNTWICTINFLIKKEVVEKHNLNFTEKKVFSEDIEFIAKVISASNKINYIDKTLSSYYINNSSITNKFSYKRLQFLSTIKSIEKLNLSQDEKIALNSFFTPYFLINILLTMTVQGLPKDKFFNLIKSKIINNSIKKYKPKSLKEKLKKILILKFPNVFYYITNKKFSKIGSDKNE